MPEMLPKYVSESYWMTVVAVAGVMALEKISTWPDDAPFPTALSKNNPMSVPPEVSTSTPEYAPTTFSPPTLVGPPRRANVSAWRST